MDDLTHERYPHAVPVHELHQQPTPLVRSPVDVGQRRIILCGTDDLNVLEPGGDLRDLAALARERRLVDAMRAWAA